MRSKAREVLALVDDSGKRRLSPPPTSDDLDPSWPALGKAEYVGLAHTL